MIFKYVNIYALKGKNHQRRATPCDWRAEPFQALKGRNPKRYLMSPVTSCVIAALSLPLTSVISCFFYS